MKAAEIFMLMRGASRSELYNASAGHHIIQVWGAFVRPRKNFGVTGLLSSSELAMFAADIYHAP